MRSVAHGTQDGSIDRPGPEHRTGRSLWAWGWRARFPDDAARSGLVQLAGALLPGSAPALRPLPPGHDGDPEVAPPGVAVPDALAAFATQAPRDRARCTRSRAFADLVAGFAG